LLGFNEEIFFTIPLTNLFTQMTSFHQSGNESKKRKIHSNLKTATLPIVSMLAKLVLQLYLKGGAYIRDSSKHYRRNWGNLIVRSEVLQNWKLGGLFSAAKSIYRRSSPTSWYEPKIICLDLKVAINLSRGFSPIVEDNTTCISTGEQCFWSCWLLLKQRNMGACHWPLNLRGKCKRITEVFKI
jgi:hypothetical protein